MTGAETVLDAPLLGSRFHRELHLRKACSDTLFDALDYENGGERTDRDDWRGGVLSHSAWRRQ